MADWIYLKHPAVLEISNDGGVSFGGQQDWYRDSFRQKAGCGPTACANQLWYLSQTRAGYASLCGFDCSNREGFADFLDAVWNYVTPGAMGVNSAKIFTDGVKRYAVDKNLKIACDILEIPRLMRDRPSRDMLRDYLADALCDDRPIAFLNLTNGTLDNLDSWHWVTLAAVAPDSMTALMYDAGQATEINLGCWLETTALGGGFVTIRA